MQSHLVRTTNPNVAHTWVRVLLRVLGQNFFRRNSKTYSSIGSSNNS